MVVKLYEYVSLAAPCPTIITDKSKWKTQRKLTDFVNSQCCCKNNIEISRIYIIKKANYKNLGI